MKLCQIEGCDKAVWARGWCSMHYYRWHRTGDPLKARPKLPPHLPCSVEGCQQPNEANGLCRTHRARLRYSGDPGSAERRRSGPPPKPPAPCALEGCERPAASRFNGEGPYCRLHYERQRLGRPIGPVGLLDAPDGSGTDNQGYRRIRVPDGRRIMEHVYVMEQQLGRRLEPGENIHHRNGIKTDNRIENLELWVTMQPTGQRLEDLIAFVVEHYPDEVRKALS